MSSSRNKNKNLHIFTQKRHSGRSLNPDPTPTYRSKTPQPPAPNRSKSNRSYKPRKFSKKNKSKTPKRLLQYRSRKDSQPEKEIEDELPDYIKATTPQPHMTRTYIPQNIHTNLTSVPPQTLQRSKSGNYNRIRSNSSHNNNQSPQDIPQFSPMNAQSHSGNSDNSMFTFVKQQFDSDYNQRVRANSNHSLRSNTNAYNPHTQVPLPPMPIIQSQNTTPIPMVHNSLHTPPQNTNAFDTTKIHQIPKPQSRTSPMSVPPQSQRRDSNSSYRQRADSGVSNASNSVLLSVKQMENTTNTILSHYDTQQSRSQSNSLDQSNVSHSRKKTPFVSNDKTSPKDSTPKDKKWGFFTASKRHSNSKLKQNKKRDSKSKKHHKKRSSHSHSKPFNDSDELNNEQIAMAAEKRLSIEKEQIFRNKLHPAYTPLAPPKSTPPLPKSGKGNSYRNIPQINPVQPLPAYNPTQSAHSYILPITNDDRMRSNSSHQSHSDRMLMNEPIRKSHTMGDYDYTDQNEFMDDREVAQKSFAYNQSLRKQNVSPMDNNDEMDIEQVERDVDKMRFRCDQLDWNLSTLQTNTDKDIRQITAKIHRVEHDMRTQNELTHGQGQGKNSIFHSLESSIGAVMRNVDSIKDALQTLDLRMSIINQRQHDIFKHIDETKDILDNAQSVTVSDKEPLALNPMEKSNTLSSRRASLQSMSEMLRLQSISSMSGKHEECNVGSMGRISEESGNENNNPLILPTYDDNEDILNPHSATKKKLLGHIRPELLIQNNNEQKASLLTQRVLRKGKSTDVMINSCTGSGIAITRMYTVPNTLAIQQTMEEKSDRNTLQSIVECNADSSTESMLSQEDKDLVKQSSISRRTHKHIRSTMDSGLSGQIMGKIKYETMLIHSSDSDNSDNDSVSDMDMHNGDSDEKAMESNPNTVRANGEDIDEEKQYMINKANRRKRSAHSRSIGVSMDDDSGQILSNIDMKTLEMPVEKDPHTQPVQPSNNRKYSESYSINPLEYETHAKNTSTQTMKGNMTMLHQLKTKQRIPKQKTKASDLFNNNTPNIPKVFQQQPMSQQQRDKRRGGSMSYDVGQEPNIKYEREVSHTMEVNAPGIIDIDLKNQSNALPDDESDSVSDLSAHESDSVSDLSDNPNDSGTFVVHGDTLKEALQLQKDAEAEQKENEAIIHEKINSFVKDESEKKLHKKKKSKKKTIQLMNCKFKLHCVPQRYTVISDYIIHELYHKKSEKASYVLTICNNTTSHDLFFKASQTYKCRGKTLRYFKEMDSEESEEADHRDSIISLDTNDDSDDHLAPMEHMTFGDIKLEKGVHYSGYFVFEAYPFLGNDDDELGNKSRQPTTFTGAITPNCKDNPLTPRMKTHAILTAIDEKHKTRDFTQFNELKLGTVSPSTMNKYRRQSLSTSRRASFISPKKGNTLSINEHSVMSLLGRALDEEHNESQNNYPWNDGLDDLVDIVMGYDIELSMGDPYLNKFTCFIQFSEYKQPAHYKVQLANLKQLQAFCQYGGNGTHLSHDRLFAKISINDKNTIHPQIVFNVGYSAEEHPQIVKQPSNHETLDID